MRANPTNKTASSPKRAIQRSTARNPVDSIALVPVDPAAGPVFTWEQALRVLQKNHRLAVLCALSLTLVTVSVAFSLKDIYQPTARLEFDPPTSGIQTLHEIEYASEPDNQDYLETQARILQSEALAVRVIRALQLDRNPEFVHKSDIAKYGKIQASARQSDPRSAKESTFLQEQFDLVDRTPLESIALDAFQRRLFVNPVRNSRLIEVSFASHDPQLAQLITNTLVTQFMDQNYQNRYTTTMEASGWLSTQLNDLRKKVQESNQAVADYQRKYGFIDTDDRDVPMAQYMADVDHQLSDAQATRIELEAYLRMINTGQSESIPALREDPVHQNLSIRYADVRAQLAQARAVYGDENSNVKKLENEADELAAQLEAEKMRVADQVRTSFKAASDRERMMLQTRDKVRAQLGDASSHMVEYTVLKNEALATAGLYNTLQARLREAGIYAGLRASNIRIVDLAARLRKPTRPHREVIIGTGLVISCMAALILAFAKESFDNTIRTPLDIRNWTGLPSLAMLPPIGGGDSFGEKNMAPHRMLGTGGIPPAPKILLNTSRTAEAEAVRDLRTTLAYSRSGAAPRVVLVTSSSVGEGKTTVAINLAAVYAKRGRTLLVDGDLRQPTIASALGMEHNSGLADVLAGAIPLANALHPLVDFPNLFVLPAGPAPKNSVDLIASDQMRATVLALRNNFDHVVIDSPPAIPYSDARILSSLTDSVVIVARYELTTRRALARCAELLDGVLAPLSGVVLNGINTFSADYQYYNYGFCRRMNGHQYYESEEKTKPRSADPPQPPGGQEKARGAHA